MVGIETKEGMLAFDDDVDDDDDDDDDKTTENCLLLLKELHSLVRDLVKGEYRPAGKSPKYYLKEILFAS